MLAFFKLEKLDKIKINNSCKFVKFVVENNPKLFFNDYLSLLNKANQKARAESSCQDQYRYHRLRHIRLSICTKKYNYGAKICFLLWKIKCSY